MNISVKKRTGENIIAIAEQVDMVVDRHRANWGPGTRITKLMDQSKEIRNLVKDLENNILSGLVLVIVVLFFFLGLRNAVLVALAIPFSMLLSFMVLNLLGISLNMVVLFSLTLALGMLVDNAVVIIENIYRYMEQGVGRVAAAMKGTAEVAWPVIGSSATTIAAFAPMIFWPDIMGAFMRYLPITLIITLSSSLFVALVINPTFGALFMRLKSDSAGEDAATVKGVTATGEQPVEVRGRLLTSYVWLLRAALNHRLPVVLMSVLFLGLLFQVWLIVIGLERPVEFFPSIDPSNAYVNLDLPEGSDLAYNDRLLKLLEMRITGAATEPTNPLIEVDPEAYQAAYRPKTHATPQGEQIQGPSDLQTIEHIYAKAVKTPGAGALFGNTADNHLGIQFLDLADRAESTSQSLEEIRRRIGDMPGAKITVEKEEGGPPTGAPINIEISGDRFEVLGKLAKSIEKLVRNIPHVEDVQNDYQEAIPALRVRVDRQKAAMFGLTTSALGLALKTAYNGLDVSTYYEGDDEYDITVILPEAERKHPDVLQRLMIPSSSGELVPLTTLAAIDYTGILGDIIRIDQQRVVTVKANVDESKVPGAVARMQAEKMLADFQLPPGYRIKFTGEFEDQQKSQTFLSKAFLIALFLIFFILVTLFNSVAQPMIILTSVVLSLGGVFLGLVVIDKPFGVIMTGVGVISLAGVVVNNAIVLIDYTNKLLARGMALREAVVAAGATRLRPVMLTAVTTILGLIPMVTGVSFDFSAMAVSWVNESTQWWQSMAAVVIFGLMIATFLTLVVVPVLYTVMDDARRWAPRSVRWLRRMYWKPVASNNSVK